MANPGPASTQTSNYLLNGNVTYKPTVTQNSDGTCPLRSYGRYHRIRVTPTGTWTHAISIDVDYTQSGTR